MDGTEHDLSEPVSRVVSKAATSGQATRQFAGLGILWVLCCVVAAIILSGCANRYGHLLANDDKDMVGSHEAGAATWNPLVDSSVAKLLGRCPPPNETMIPGAEFDQVLAAQTPTGTNPTGATPAMMASHANNSDPQFLLNGPGDAAAIGSGTVHPGAMNPAAMNPAACGPLVTGPARVCFVGIENKSAEELVDFKDQLYERIDSQINSGHAFRSISRRLVDAALLETRLRPDSLFLPANRGAFAAALGRQGSPVDYLLYATITSGTTDRNKSTQRDYVLTLEMVNLHSGDYIKESSKIRKGYHKSRAGKWWNFGLFDQADG